MTNSATYQLILLGHLDHRALELRKALVSRLADLGLDGGVVTFIETNILATWDRRAPTMALFFGDASVAANSDVLTQLAADSVVIAPIVSDLTRVSLEVPPQLTHINALRYAEAADAARLASLVLETFRLLRAERRLFISYCREDAQPLAEILYNALDARGFDVFIDVRSVPPAADFQSVLWHRMADSDVVVLIDTPGFRARRWTTEELAQANATNIQILHLLWPGQSEDPASSFSHFMKLGPGDFSGSGVGRGEGATADLVSRICSQAERLRARAIAARNRYLMDNFCDAATDLGLTATVQPERWIALTQPNGRTLAAVPAVGVPTSDRLNAAFEAIADTVSNQRDLWLIYDNRGVMSKWLSHLEWLNTHLPVRTVRMSDAPAALKALVS
jgi:hypothetical protein